MLSCLILQLYMVLSLCIVLDQGRIQDFLREGASQAEMTDVQRQECASQAEMTDVQSQESVKELYLMCMHPPTGYVGKAQLAY